MMHQVLSAGLPIAWIEMPKLPPREEEGSGGVCFEYDLDEFTEALFLPTRSHADWALAGMCVSWQGVFVARRSRPGTRTPVIGREGSLVVHMLTLSGRLSAYRVSLALVD
eukprot:Polyplicarium_translucidae@DN1856_c0_g1_i2.p2